MPTYEYICEKCDHEFEIFQTMSSEPLETCPRELCPRKRWGKGKVRRAIGSGAGLIFKGDGFYITDYRSENYQQAAKKDVEIKSKNPPKTSDSSSGAKGGDAKTKPAPPKKT